MRTGVENVLARTIGLGTVYAADFALFVPIRHSSSVTTERQKNGVNAPVFVEGDQPTMPED
jgi:hypothetical protein